MKGECFMSENYVIKYLKVNGKLIEPLSTESSALPVVTAQINPYDKNMLSAHVFIAYDYPVSYTYTVLGKTEDVNFSYGISEYILNPTIPVIGLYADQITTVRVDLKGEDGSEVVIGLDLNATNMDFTGHLMTLEIEIYDDDMAEATINNGWLFNDFMDGYDKNGDLRVCGLTGDAGAYITFKTYDDAIYIPSERTFETYSDSYIKYNILGKKLNEYILPEGTGVHHDITFDDDGYIYILGNFNIEPEDHIKSESLIYKFVEETGELVATRDFSDTYYESMVIKDSPVNDVHFNSITYVQEISQLIVNSRNSCSYMALDKYTLLPVWNVDNPADKLLLESYRNLSVVNPDEFIYQNGEHTVFVSYNEKYEDYRGDGKIVLSMFDNVACKDEEGNDIVRLNESPDIDTDAGYEWESAVQIVAIDLHRGTIEQLDRFTIEGERSRITSSVFDTENHKYFQVYYGVPQNFYVIDTDGKIGVAAKMVTTAALSYRARIKSYEEMRRLLRD